MLKIIRIIAILFTAAATCLVVPRFFGMLFHPHYDYTNIVYSEILDDFITSKYEYQHVNGRITSHTIYRDSKGNTYSREQADSLCPLNNASQLMYEGKFPDSICGRPVSAKEVSDATYQMYISTGYDRLFYGLSELKDQKNYLSKKYEPQDLFRINKNGIEFIVSAQNKVDREKSRLFNEALSRAGFTPPATRWWAPANTTDFEKYGYLVLDQHENLFQLSMNDNRPAIARLNRPDGKKVRGVNFSNRDGFLAIIATDDGHAYIMDRELNYKPLPLPSLKNKQVQLQGNLMFLTFTVSGQDTTSYYVLDKNYTPINHLSIPKQKNIQLQETAGSYLFPVRIFQHPVQGIRVKFSDPLHFIWLNILWAAVTFCLKKKRGYPVHDISGITDLIWVLVFGIFGMAGVLAIPPQKHKSQNKESL